MSKVLAKRSRNRVFLFSDASKERLTNVHPALVKVARRALEITPYDFGISEGVRTIARQRYLMSIGRSWTMRSKHLRQVDGYAHALDIAVLDENGKYTTNVGYYRKVMQAFVTAAIELGVQVEFGGLWKTVFDGPHIQLNQKYL